MTIPTEMNSTLPQQVTNRYVGRLIRKGANDEFELINLLRQNATADDLVVGHYYQAVILRVNNSCSESAAGVTPFQAVQRALGKVGVTFRP
jgi:hypothetical protein